LKSSSDGGESSNNNANKTMVVPMMGSGECAFGGSMESDGWFCAGASDRNLASVTMKMFSHLLYFINFLLSIQFAKILLQ
jgi:hypothetical protein